MPVRLLRAIKGLAPGAIYSGDDEGLLFSLGLADSNLASSLDYPTFTTDASVNDASRPIHTVSATAWLLGPADANRELRFTAATAVTVTVPSQLVVNLPNGIIATIRQDGAGQVTVVGASGVTVNSQAATAKTLGQFSVIQVEKIGPQTAEVFGSLAAS